MSFIVKVATSYPEFSLTEKELKTFLLNIWPEKSLLIENIAKSTTTQNRHFTLPFNYYSDLKDVGIKNIIWKAEAAYLQKENLEGILRESKIDIADIGLIASVATTGLAVPGIEILLMNQFPFSPNMKRLPLFGLGHVGGVAGINSVNDYLISHPGNAAILMVTELRSLALQSVDDTDANIKATSFFGDGAGALLMVGKDHPMALTSNFEVLSTESIFYPVSEQQGEKYLKYEMGKYIDEFLKKNKTLKGDINYFIASLGEADILDGLSEIFECDKGKFSMSWNSLKTRGNTYAASVLHVLEQTISAADIAPKSVGLMMAAGSDFSLELCLLKRT